MRKNDEYRIGGKIPSGTIQSPADQGTAAADSVAVAAATIPRKEKQRKMNYSLDGRNLKDRCFCWALGAAADGTPDRQTDGWKDERKDG